MSFIVVVIGAKIELFPIAICHSKKSVTNYFVTILARQEYHRPGHEAAAADPCEGNGELHRHHTH